MRPVVGYQQVASPSACRAEQHVEEQRMDHVVAMVPEGDLVGAQFLGRPVDDAAAQAARTQRTGRLALGYLVLDYRIGVGLDDAVLDPQ